MFFHIPKFHNGGKFQEVVEEMEKVQPTSSFRICDRPQLMYLIMTLGYYKVSNEGNKIQYHRNTVNSIANEPRTGDVFHKIAILIFFYP